MSGTRRSCSVSREAFAVIVELRERTGLSLSQIVERSVAAARRGEIDLGAPEPAHVAAMRTKETRYGATPESDAAKVAADNRMASAAVPARLKDAPLEVSPGLLGLVGDIARRSGAAPGVVLGRAIERMVSHLASNPASWCGQCLQQFGDCACKAARRTR